MEHADQLVPLFSTSGSLTKLLGLAILRISLASVISTMKVDLPRAISSVAPMRV